MMSLISVGLTLLTLPGAFAATFNVSVGAGSLLRYNPESITAAAGDVINFIFHPKNHTVTQSSFNSPCVPLAGGFNSGLCDRAYFVIQNSTDIVYASVPVASENSTLTTLQVTIDNATAPLWFYCQQQGHCGQGMVFAVNAPADPNSHSFSAFQALAISTNGTNATTTSASASSYITPPAPSVVTVTATVTEGTSMWTTTYASYEGTPPPTPAAQPVDHQIVVGANGKLAYNPSNISASIGDTVTFQFQPKNHTVTQSSFLKPCQPLADTSTTGQVGFASGFMPVSANATSFPTFQIKINDTAPIWGYCGQAGHCGQGMVFSINAVESGPNNFSAFQTLAERINGTGTTGSGTSTSPSAAASSSSSATRVLGQHGYFEKVVLLVAVGFGIVTYL